MARYSKAEKQKALTELRKLCPPGTTVYTILRHVSRSGMQREIFPLVIRKGEYRGIWWYVARVLDLRIGKSDGLIIGGCGMDMGFHLVNSLSYALHGHKDRGADAIEHSTAGRPFTPRRGHYRAGYSLIHRWI